MVLPVESFCRFPFPVHRIEGVASEQLGYDNPSAQQIASPFFDAGGRIAAITERVNYHCGPEVVPEPIGNHSFTLCLQGELGVLVGDKMHWCEPGQLVFTPLGSPMMRKSRPQGKVWFLYVDLFDRQPWTDLAESGPFVRDYEYADQMFLLLRRTLDIHRSRRIESIPLAHANIRGFVALLRHELTLLRKPRHPTTEALAALVEEIQQHPGRTWNTSEMAKGLNMSRATLTRLFQEQYGLPPKALVVKERITYAIQELTSSFDSIEVIANKAGYKSQFTFSHIFKKHTGMRPGAFRRAFSK